MKLGLIQVCHSEGGSITERLPVSEIPLHKVVEIDLSAQVKTHMTTDPDITEDLRKTLLATRNPDAYGAITKETNVPTWDEAFCGKVPH